MEELSYSLPICINKEYPTGKLYLQIYKLDLAHWKINTNCIHRKDNSLKPVSSILENSESMISSQTSRGNKRVTSPLKFGYPHLTFKEGPKVKSDHIRRFLVKYFLEVCFTSQNSRTNNKRVICTFETPRTKNKQIISPLKFEYHHLTLKERSKVKSDHIRKFPAHDFL